MPAAESFGAYVQFAISQWLVAGHPQPTHLYLGFAEREAMADATRHMATVADPRLPRTGKTMYHGLEVVRVDEPTFFRVG